MTNQWRYQWGYFNLLDADELAKEYMNLAEFLDGYGEDGWELVSSSGNYFFFKKQSSEAVASELISEFEFVEKQIDRLQADFVRGVERINQKKAEVEEIKENVITLQSALEEAYAAGAAMRSVLKLIEFALEHNEQFADYGGEVDLPVDIFVKVKNALSSNVGKDTLTRIARLETALEFYTKEENYSQQVGTVTGTANGSVWALPVSAVQADGGAVARDALRKRLSNA